MSHYFLNDSNLKSEIVKTNIKIKNKEYIFCTDNGVFAKRGLDLGTHILLDTIPLDKIHGYVLDLGCGYGPIGIFVKKELPDTNVDMIDINKRALKLAILNASENKVDVNVFESDGYSAVNQKYNYIISNPPIRVGKKVLYDLLNNAYDYLTNDGELWIVIHKDQGAKSTARELSKKYKVEVKNKSHGFFIICASK